MRLATTLAEPGVGLEPGEPTISPAAGLLYWAEGLLHELLSDPSPAAMQVTGFVVNPDKPGKRFMDGVLVPY